MIEELRFAFGITGPILILLALGSVVRRVGLVDASFISQANALVYNIALPVMLFFAISSRPLAEAFDPVLTLTGLIGTLVLIGILLIVGRLVPEDQRGVFVQGSYRGNLAILGVALAVATYGDDVLPLVAVYVAVVTTIYNVVAVWVLNSTGAMRQIIRNPILIGILAGVIAALVKLPVPAILVDTGGYLSAMTLPVALLCIGANLELASLASHKRSILLASFFKLIISPLLLVSMGLLAGLEGTSLGVLFFLAASPTASASYVIARQLTTHGALAAEIIAVTTALGVFSYTAGLALLRNQGLI